MNCLHNRLIAAYEAATHKSLDEAHAREHLRGLAELLSHWSAAMVMAFLGDEKADGYLQDAYEAARRADARTEPLGIPAGSEPVIRAHVVFSKDRSPPEEGPKDRNEVGA